jgi:hypothetical protein
MRFASNATNPHPPKTSRLAAMKGLAVYPVEVSDNLPISSVSQFPVGCFDK